MPVPIALSKLQAGSLQGDGVDINVTETGGVVTVSQTSSLANLSVAGNANVTLTTAQAASKVIELTGVLTGAISVIAPLAGISAGAQRTINNKTTGAYALTFIGDSGTGIVVGTGKVARVYFDGTNWVRASADV
jgi:hypothetical protein